MPDDRPSDNTSPEPTAKKTRKRTSAPKAKPKLPAPPAASANDAPAAPAPKQATKPAPKAAPKPRARAVAKPRATTPEAPPAETVAVTPAPSLSVLIVTSEAHPYAKTGGLAEVTAALADSLTRLGHSVTLVLPRYRGIDVTGASRLQARLRLGDRLQPVTYHERWITERQRLVLVDVPDLFDREALYGTADGDYPDNAWRFAVFSRAALEFARLKEWRPSVIHAHDWQTGLVPVYQKMHLSGDPFVGGVPAVFTLHNLAFQGVFPAATLPAIGLNQDVFDIQAMEFWGNISFLKGGINFSEKITTVSPGYAREILGPDLGFGLDGVLRRRADDLVGILNGIDTARWTPTNDSFVPASFSADDLAGKREAKRAVLTAANLPRDEAALARPLVGLISRLTEQKGFDLIAAAAERLLALDASWILLGSGERRFEDIWRTLAARHPDRIAVTIGFDERLAHLIEAGADMFLMPSRFEPCGLNQMYSLRYGTVPIVRATGGLDDTVVDVDVSPERGTGFKFVDYTPGALAATVERAFRAFGDRVLWEGLQRRGMKQDHSWDASARAYVKLYASMMETVLA
jgi:starch synthase